MRKQCKKTDEMKARGLLSRADAIKSSGLSESGFARLDLKPVERIGRQTFYSVRQIVAAVLTRDAARSDLIKLLRNVSPAAAKLAAGAVAEKTLD